LLRRSFGGKKILLVIAYPGDDATYFIPSILQLAVECKYFHRVIENRKDDKVMYRVWIKANISKSIRDVGNQKLTTRLHPNQLTKEQ